MMIAGSPHLVTGRPGKVRAAQSDGDLARWPALPDLVGAARDPALAMPSRAMSCSSRRAAWTPRAAAVSGARPVGC
jgi:hypothetical protein